MVLKKIIAILIAMCILVSPCMARGGHFDDDQGSDDNSTNQTVVATGEQEQEQENEMNLGDMIKNFFRNFNRNGDNKDNATGNVTKEKWSVFNYGNEDEITIAEKIQNLNTIENINLMSNELSKYNVTNATALVYCDGQKFYVNSDDGVVEYIETPDVVIVVSEKNLGKILNSVDRSFADGEISFPERMAMSKYGILKQFKLYELGTTEYASYV